MLLFADINLRSFFSVADFFSVPYFSRASSAFGLKYDSLS